MSQREIKFRAWDKKGKCWFSPDEFRVDGEGSLFFTDYDRPARWSNWGEEYEIMQYTGLKDKNGVEIYEGDIVRKEIEDYTGDPHNVLWGEGSFESYYGYVGWSLGGLEYSDESFASKEAAEYTIIGNIYENPELIKK